MFNKLLNYIEKINKYLKNNNNIYFSKVLGGKLFLAELAKPEI